MKRGFLNTAKANKAEAKLEPKQVIPGSRHAFFFDETIRDGDPEDGAIVQLSLFEFLLSFLHIGADSNEVESGNTGVRVPLCKKSEKLPSEFKLPKLNISFTDAGTENVNDHMAILTTIPPRGPNETWADSQDGWSECMFHGGYLKRALFSIPGFPTAVPKPPVVRHHIGPSAYGLGMFAAVDIEPGDLIVAERPLLVFPPYGFARWPKGGPTELSPAQTLQVTYMQQEERLKICVERMLPEARKKFFALFNSHLEDGSGPIFGIARTNAIKFAPVNEDSEKSHMYTSAAVFDAISRANHSCCPNARYTANASSFSLSLRALRSIKAGEQIFINYGVTSEPTAKRRSVLLPYGFSCTCALCTDPSSDALLTLILESLKTKPGQRIDQIINDSMNWVKVIEDAKMEHVVTYFLHLVRLVGCPLEYVGKARAIYEKKCDAWTMATHGMPYKAYIAVQK
ncbi:hypothetical protein H0H87_006103 [Tephrocybe sp. NHM501043]|nr:hypothetical protein H0H87_006103 [Tephrocybe sp. NHM501043]